MRETNGVFTLDEMRAEFARFLASDPQCRWRMDSALAHVITLAYERGLADGLKDAAKPPRSKAQLELRADMSYTLTETGKVLTETQQGITMPADYSFATVNDYVHGLEVHFEDLQALCLGMADYIDKLLRGEFICVRCGLRKDSEHDGACEF